MRTGAEHFPSFWSFKPFPCAFSLQFPRLAAASLGGAGRTWEPRPLRGAKRNSPYVSPHRSTIFAFPVALSADTNQGVIFISLLLRLQPWAAGSITESLLKSKFSSVQHRPDHWKAALTKQGCGNRRQTMRHFLRNTATYCLPVFKDQPR